MEHLCHLNDYERNVKPDEWIWGACAVDSSGCVRVRNKQTSCLIAGHFVCYESTASDLYKANKYDCILIKV